MKKLILPSIAAAFAVAISHAAPSDDVSAAAKKLGDAANYSWSRTTESVAPAGGGGGGRGGFGGGPSEGMTEKGGFTVTTTSFGGTPRQTVRKGEQSVVQNQDGNWMTTEELRAQFGGGGGGQGGGARGGGRGGFGFGGGQVNPAEEVVALAGQTKGLKSADGAIVGDLTDEAVTQRLSFGGGRGGQAPAAPKNAAGSVKFWLKDGAIAKYQVHVKGTVTTGRGEVERDTTTTTEIKNVGTTKIEVPEAAKKKFGA